MNAAALFPSFALALGILASVYLLKEWFRHERRWRFLALWAAALFLMYWFQIPAILANLGVVVTVSKFNFFFALTLPVTFLALIFIYLGILDALEINIKKAVKILLGAWFFSAALFFGYNFIASGGVIQTDSVPLAGKLAIYLPLRLLIIATLAWWLWRARPLTLFGVLGAAGVIGESMLGIIRNLLVVKTVLAYPPSFWYIAMTSLQSFFILQTASVILAAVGFYFLHRMYFRAHPTKRGFSRN